MQGYDVESLGSLTYHQAVALARFLVLVVGHPPTTGFAAAPFKYKVMQYCRSGQASILVRIVSSCDCRLLYVMLAPVNTLRTLVSAAAAAQCI